MKWLKRVAWVLCVIAFCSQTITAQTNFSSFQQQWLEEVKQGNDVSAYEWERGYLFYPSSSNSQLKYLSNYQLRILQGHDPVRFLAIGTVKNEQQQEEMLMVTAYRSMKDGLKKEMDLLLPIDEPFVFGNDVPAEKEIGLRREEWIELANQHNPDRHIRALYTQDATYLSGGTLSLGWGEIIERYAFMKSESYSVDLIEKYLYQLTSSKVLEVGRYFTGNNTSGPGGIYFILWSKSASGKWDIELDFNY